ncbi:hypothetical protein [Streptomyces sp. NBC_00996]|uniref:hypothetical protein n=1 Tax=Streptomyces sp. NBC_00996 TaxID=2903710 RepID=UPI0038630AB4|nr:hypothetical protein OG390_17515 [Streptomyces sp. NBC_00996]
MQTSIAHTDRPPTLSAFVPPLDIARVQARRTLTEAMALDLETADSLTVAGEFGAVRESLRQVLAALDADDAQEAPEPDDALATMTVRVCDRGTGPSYVGVTIRTVTVPAVCPVCGGPRGVDSLRSEQLPEDGEWYTVSRWENPCGHVDLYADVLREARAYAGFGERDA